MIDALTALAFFQLTHIAECQYALDSLVLWIVGKLA